MSGSGLAAVPGPLGPLELFSLSIIIASGSDSSPSQDMGRGNPLLARLSSLMLTFAVFSMFDSSVSDSSDSSIFGTVILIPTLPKIVLVLAFGVLLLLLLPELLPDDGAGIMLLMLLAGLKPGSFSQLIVVTETFPRDSVDVILVALLRLLFFTHTKHTGHAMLRQ
uniref:Putative nuclear hormone receptor ftz-f1 beta n=1 Tax=Aedes albopictus TaxID=7160 RepID=A0A1W7R6N4_AEDAL